MFGKNRKVFIDVSYFRYRTSDKETGGEQDMQCETSCGTEKCERRFLTNEEKAEKLGEYKNWLESEAKGVDETIARLKKGN